MHYLTERIQTAQASAAGAASDIRIKEFLDALRIFKGPSDGGPRGVWIDCHERFWFRTLTESDLAAVETLSSVELAILITSWVQEAINAGALSLSNPPDPACQRRSNDSGALLAAGLVTTYVYDTNGGFMRRYSG